MLKVNTMCDLCYVGEYKCPKDWRVFRNECIYIETGVLSTWHQAKGKCDALNASMLTIDDEEKNNYISGEFFF